MANAAVAQYDNIIPFEVIIGNKNKKNQEPKKPNNRVAGQDSEVYAFKTKEEIKVMIDVFDKHIEEATNDNQRMIAYRNKMLFVIGINVGIRASDLRELKWSFFFDVNADGTLRFKEFYKFVPKKTSKTRKYVRINFNDAVKKIVNAYIAEYPINDMDGYLFPSRKGNNPVSVDGLRMIIKDAAKEAGIKQNIGSHSLRKTFAYQIWHNATDKNKALVTLQTIFNHSSPAITARYIGITNDEVKDMFDNLNLGIDDI